MKTIIVVKNGKESVIMINDHANISDIIKSFEEKGYEVKT